LGNFIFSGLQTENWIFVLVGCAAAALLALIVDQLLGLIEAGLAHRQRGRLGVGFAGLGLGLALALIPLTSEGRSTYLIGAKNFAEQFILGELVGDLLERQGLAVDHKDDLGSAIIFRALASNELDVYVDYSGTLWTNVIGRRDLLGDEAMLAELTRALRERYGVRVLGRLGFENAYVFAMRADRASALGVHTIADLASHAGQLTLGSDLEFLSRPEWTAVRSAYALKFRSERSFNPTFMYRAIDEGDADVITAFSTDGRIAAQHLVVLGDPKRAILAYDALLLISPRRAMDARLTQALAPLVGAISVDLMREANLMVDRDLNKRSPKEAAQFLATHLKGSAS
jgi:osmoprotectant transport system permease protein